MSLIKSAFKVEALLKLENGNPVGLVLPTGEVAASFGTTFLRWAQKRAKGDLGGLLSDWTNGTRCYVGYLRTNAAGDLKLFVLGSTPVARVERQVEVFGTVKSVKKGRLTVACKRDDVEPGPKAHQRPFIVSGQCSFPLPEVGSYVRLGGVMTSRGVVFDELL